MRRLALSNDMSTGALVCIGMNETATLPGAIAKALSENRPCANVVRVT